MLLKHEEAARILEELKDSEPRLKVAQRDALETAIECLVNNPGERVTNYTSMKEYNDAMQRHKKENGKPLY